MSKPHDQLPASGLVLARRSCREVPLWKLSAGSCVDARVGGQIDYLISSQLCRQEPDK
jgi:hypothetical protein